VPLRPTSLPCKRIATIAACDGDKEGCNDFGSELKSRVAVWIFHSRSVTTAT
jgi:hypothetical protein